MTEDDTFEALKRIPYHELVSHHGATVDFVSSIERIRDSAEKIEERHKFVDKWFGWLLGPQEPIWLTGAPTVNKESVDNAFAGTGWTCDSLIKELNKKK
jgi:hypothetical protein